MKKELKLLFILAVIILETLLLTSKMVFFAADATYVEGYITQDTVWTLTESPFVVSNNITIQNAQLTIEPGVEVRFGGPFSINVEENGTIYAVGKLNNNITFTSNKDEPQAGDWDTIKFKGAVPSTLEYCVLRYATNGITIINSNVTIKYSDISGSYQNGIIILNSTAKILNNQINENTQNGILIDNGVVDAQDNTISDNLNSGIYITGASQVNVQNNIIRANENGVLLTGNSTMSANIIRNTMLSNNQSGIYLDSNDFSNIVILYNTLSANNKGFYVSGQTSTQITNNSISYNTVGIFYEKNSHSAHWNDIYGNSWGMDVESEASVNATYNYWGDESGPYHASLNPSGKGNPVGGNGETLDFVFFLTAPIGYINQRPVANLLTDKTLVPPNQLVWFIAVNSSDDRQVNQYFYDFGDGTNSSWTTLSIFVHKYSSVGNYTARVVVRDDFDVTSTNAANVEITVQELTPIEVSLTLARSTVGSEGQVSITVWTSVGTSKIRLVSIIKGSLEISFDFTNSTGYLTTTFTAPKVDEQTDVRIIATASKNSYADGSDYEYLRVLPPLSVQVFADPNSIKSEASTHVIVHVTHKANPIPEATITMSSDKGSFLAETGYTDLNGSLAFTFNAPQVITQTNVTVTATVRKSGYLESMGQTRITVNPRVLAVQVIPNQGIFESEAALNMTVHVTDEAKPVAGANVTVSSDLVGLFSPSTGTTNSNGDFKFVYVAPKVTTQANVTITASAAKSGYINGENQAKILVNPVSGAEAGLPLTTILLILIPVVVVAIVAILIKMKIIVIGHEES